MNVNINVTFYNGRCLFNGFNRRNDIDPITHRVGVNYYKFHWIGCILEKIGIARGLHCYVNGEPKIIYINKKSFLKWRERHSKDQYISFRSRGQIEHEQETLDGYAKREKDCNDYLNNPKIRRKYPIIIDGTIIEECSDRPQPLEENEIRARDALQSSLNEVKIRAQRVLNFDDDYEGSIKYLIQRYKTLSFEEVMEKAQRELPNDESKPRRLSRLEYILNRNEYAEAYDMKEIPEISLGKNGHFPFIYTLPGVIVGVNK